MAEKSKPDETTVFRGLDGVVAAETNISFVDGRTANYSIKGTISKILHPIQHRIWRLHIFFFMGNYLILIN